EARERCVALQQRVARQLTVAVPVEERLRPGRQLIVLILERVRQLVGDEELAHQIAPGEEPEQAHAGAYARDAPGGHQPLRARVVEARALLLVEPLERGPELGARGEESEAHPHGLGALDVAGGIALRDLLLDDGPQPLAREHEHGHWGREPEPAERRETDAQVCERVLVHLAVTDETPGGTAGEERQQNEERPPARPPASRGARSGTMRAGEPSRTARSARSSAAVRSG